MIVQLDIRQTLLIDEPILIGNPELTDPYVDMLFNVVVFSSALSIPVFILSPGAFAIVHCGTKVYVDN